MKRHHVIDVATPFLALALAGGAHAGGGCEPTWDPAFGLPGINSGIVFSLAAHDDGSGACAELYVGGSFTMIGGTDASRIARWDGAAWHPLGTGLNDRECYALASYAGDVFAAGYFDDAGGVEGTAKLARWDGSGWNSVDARLPEGTAQLWGLTTWDDGNGEALYIAGNYLTIGDVEDASYIAKWDGESYTPLGTPIGGPVALIIFTSYVWDDGAGEALYVGGRFLTIDGVSANRIAKWDGTEWTALDTGITGPGATPSVMSMVAFDDGDGEDLYVAGQTFNLAGGVPVNRIARWDGTEWSAVGDGFANGIVWGLEVFDDGSGPALHATGTFTMSGATEVNKVARWTGKAWEALDGGANGDSYHGLAFDDGSGSALYIGGRYTEIGGTAANGIARLAACEDDPVPGDVNGDGVTDFADLLDVLSTWGPCVDPCGCPADLDQSGDVGFPDLLLVLSNWS